MKKQYKILLAVIIAEFLFLFYFYLAKILRLRAAIFEKNYFAAFAASRGTPRGTGRAGDPRCSARAKPA